MTKVFIINRGIQYKGMTHHKYMSVIEEVKENDAGTLSPEAQDESSYESFEEDPLELLDVVESPEEYYEIISSEPELYLPLLEHEDTTKYNLIFRRIDGNLMIKYRVTPSERWVELGFMGDNYKDEDVYEEFKNSVSHRLAKGRPKNTRHHLVSELEKETPQDMLERAKDFKPGVDQPTLSHIQNEPSGKREPSPKEIEKEPSTRDNVNIDHLLEEFNHIIYNNLCGNDLTSDAKALLPLLETSNRDQIIDLIVNLQQKHDLLKRMENVSMSKSAHDFCTRSIEAKPIKSYLRPLTLEAVDKYQINLHDALYKKLTGHS